MSYKFRVILVILVLFFCSCEKQTDEGVVNLEADASPEDILDVINDGGIVNVQTSVSPITIGCFGDPDCVNLDEPRRAIVRISTGNIAVFCLNCGGTTYLNDNFFEYEYATAEHCVDFWQDIALVSGLGAKINAYCDGNPADCFEWWPVFCEE